MSVRNLDVVGKHPPLPCPPTTGSNVRPKGATDRPEGTASISAEADAARACHMSHNWPLAGQAHIPDDVESLRFGGHFPGADMVEAAAGLLTRRAPWDGAESHGAGGVGSPARRAYVRVSPGSIQVLRRDANRAEKTEARRRAAAAHQAALTDAQAAQAFADWREAAAQDYVHTDDLDALPDFDPDWTPRPRERQRITEWSAKSRANMVRKYAQLDYTDMLSRLGIPAMVTLTYPGCDAAVREAEEAAYRDAVRTASQQGRPAPRKVAHRCAETCPWRAVAPDGKAVKRHMAALRKRLKRAWGDDAEAGLWKLEFQLRGAPHIHLFLMIPPGQIVRARPDGSTIAEDFRAWLSRSWAEVVAHPDPQVFEQHRRAGTNVDLSEGVRARDPQRLAVYFSKHSAATVGGRKEYQHEVPEHFQNVGRFWGYWRLTPVTATVDVHEEHAVAAARTLRRWYRAKGLTRRVQVWRRQINADTGEVRYRKRTTTQRITRMRGNAGFITANDGPALLAQLSRYLDQIDVSDRPRA